MLCRASQKRKEPGARLPMHRAPIPREEYAKRGDAVLAVAMMRLRSLRILVTRSAQFGAEGQRTGARNGAK